MAFPGIETWHRLPHREVKGAIYFTAQKGIYRRRNNFCEHKEGSCSKLEGGGGMCLF